MTKIVENYYDIQNEVSKGKYFILLSASDEILANKDFIMTLLIDNPKNKSDIYGLICEDLRKDNEILDISIMDIAKKGSILSLPPEIRSNAQWMLKVFQGNHLLFKHFEMKLRKDLNFNLEILKLGKQNILEQIEPSIMNNIKFLRLASQIIDNKEVFKSLILKKIEQNPAYTFLNEVIEELSMSDIAKILQKIYFENEFSFKNEKKKKIKI